MEVKWIDVKGYEEQYEVSNTGIVKRKSGFIKNSLGITKYWRGSEMKPRDNGQGYLRIKLTKDNVSRRVMLHRIIAEAFIPNPNNYKCVNHIDGNKHNNSLENLEWCSHSYNCRHGWNNNGREFTENQRKASEVNLKKGREIRRKIVLRIRSAKKDFKKLKQSNSQAERKI